MWNRVPFIESAGDYWTLAPATQNTAPVLRTSLANSFPGVWKAIGNQLSRWRKKSMVMAHKTKCSPSFSQLEWEIQDLEDEQRAHDWVIIPQLTALGHRNSRTEKGKGKGKWEKFPKTLLLVSLAKKNWCCPRQSWTTPPCPLPPSLYFCQDKDFPRLLENKAKHWTLFKIGKSRSTHLHPGRSAPR